MCNIEGRPSESGGLMEGNNKALKKGPWTTVEDQILIDCVRKHGEGNWNSLRRNSSLNRCGKSCRLRWANHLHPNLKKGAFSPEEERLILQLHAKYGNKWARMASQVNNNIFGQFSSSIFINNLHGSATYVPFINFRLLAASWLLFCFGIKKW